MRDEGYGGTFGGVWLKFAVFLNVHFDRSAAVNLARHVSF